MSIGNYNPDVSGGQSHDHTFEQPRSPWARTWPGRTDNYPHRVAPSFNFNENNDPTTLQGNTFEQGPTGSQVAPYGYGSGVSEPGYVPYVAAYQQGVMQDDQDDFLLDHTYLNMTGLTVTGRNWNVSDQGPHLVAPNLWFGSGLGGEFGDDPFVAADVYAAISCGFDSGNYVGQTDSSPCDTMHPWVVVSNGQYATPPCYAVLWAAEDAYNKTNCAGGATPCNTGNCPATLGVACVDANHCAIPTPGCQMGVTCNPPNTCQNNICTPPAGGCQMGVNCQAPNSCVNNACTPPVSQNCSAANCAAPNTCQNNVCTAPSQAAPPISPLVIAGGAALIGLAALLAFSGAPQPVAAG